MISSADPGASEELPLSTETEEQGTPAADRELSPEEQAVLLERRQKVLRRMEAFVSVRWTPSETFTYQCETREFTFEKGLIYRGCPYMYGHGSLENLLDFAVGQDLTGIYTLSVSFVDSVSAKWMFSDCSGTLWQAWSTVASSVSDRVATRYMTRGNGFIPVGDYNSVETGYTNTVTTCSENGVRRMYQAYAQLQPGDAVVRWSGSGHVMMIKETHVVRDGDGKPLSNSYVLIMDQTSGNSNRKKTGVYDEMLGKTVYIVGNLEKKVSFSSLYRSGYLPITCRELIDPEAPVPKQSVTDSIRQEDVSIGTLAEGTLRTPFGISAVRIVITDQTGTAVQECVYYNNTSKLRSMDLSRLEFFPVSGNRIQPELLPPGQYHCRCEARMCAGDTVLFRDFDFTK